MEYPGQDQSADYRYDYAYQDLSCSLLATAGTTGLTNGSRVVVVGGRREWGPKVADSSPGTPGANLRREVGGTWPPRTAATLLHSRDPPPPTRMWPKKAAGGHLGVDGPVDRPGITLGPVARVVIVALSARDLGHNVGHDGEIAD